MRKFYISLLFAFLFVSTTANGQIALSVTSPDSLKESFFISFNSTGIMPPENFADTVYSQAGLACDTVFSAAARGKITLIDRGTCTLDVKVEAARRAGASACIICNNSTSTVYPNVVRNPAFSFPVFFISQGDCAKLRSKLTRAGTQPLIASMGLSATKCTTTYRPDIFWGNVPGQGDFSNGLGPWTTKSITAGDTTIKFSQFPHDIPEYGAFNGASARMVSPTSCNGVAQINFIKTQVLKNPSLSPLQTYSTELISPTINCTGRNGVSIEFYQLHNRLNRNVSYAVSIDDGVTWSAPTVIPTSNVVNAATLPVTELRSILIPTFSNQPRCKFKFIAEGDAYYFMVDDIVFTTRKIFEVKIAKDFYAGAPNVHTPYYQSQPFPLTLDILNSGNVTATNTRAIATIRRNANSQEIYRDTIKYGNVIAGIRDEDRVFPKRVTLPSGLADTGAYTITYEVQADSTAAVTDSRLSTPFNISKFIFSKTPLATANLEGWRFTGSPNFMSFGSHYKFVKGTWPNNAAITLDKVFTGASVDSIAPGAIQAAIITVDIYEWKKAATDTSVRPADRVLLATGSVPINGDNVNIEIPVFSPADASKKVVLTNTANKDIVVVTHISPLDPSKTNWFTTSINPSNPSARGFGLYNSRATSYIIGNLGGRPHNAFFASGPSDNIEERVLEPSTGLVFHNALYLQDIAITSVNLVDNDVKMEIFPNPATTLINIDLKFEATREYVSIIVTDMSGKVVSADKYVGISDRQVTVDVSDFATGIYNVKVLTDKGYQSKNINVVR